MNTTLDSKQPVSSRPAAGSGAQRVLVVDDDELNREVLSRLLIRNGYKVTLAEDGPEALEALGRQTFDLMLLDQMMPGMSGTEVLRQVRGTPGISDLPVMMVTARNQSEDVVAALEQGANDYVGKPIDCAVTVARIRALLQRNSSDRALRETEERYSLAAAGAGIGLWDWDLTTGRVYYSPSWKKLLGYGPTDLSDTSQEWLGRIHPADASVVESALERQATGARENIEIEHRLQHRDGSYRWMLCQASARRDADGLATRIAGLHTDITEARITDQLTGLGNRLRFEQELETALVHAADSQLGVAVMLLSLDRFKVFNSSLGRAAGDALLKEASVRIRHALQPELCAVARSGADFLILVPGLGAAEDALRLGKKILDAVQAPLLTDGHRVLPSARAGIAVSGPDAASVAALLRNAETAMHYARNPGSSRCALFEPHLHDCDVARMQLEDELRDAVTEGQLAVFYQPKVSLPGGRIHGFEALVRWRHPKRGLVSPSSFIPLAEETGLIAEIGLQVLRQACQDLARWRRDFPSAAELTVSVNVSSPQLSQPGLLESIQEVLRESGLPPGALSLEITESVMVENSSAAALLASIKEAGVGLEVDDFGTGYSSLNYLTRFRFDTLKVDQSFVKRLPADAETREIVQTIVQLAHKLGMKVVAEGIETAAQLSDLNLFRCDQGQGYLFSRPVDSGAVDAMLARDQHFV